MALNYESLKIAAGDRSRKTVPAAGYGLDQVGRKTKVDKGSSEAVHVARQVAFLYDLISPDPRDQMILLQRFSGPLGEETQKFYLFERQVYMFASGR